MVGHTNTILNDRDISGIMVQSKPATKALQRNMACCISDFLRVRVKSVIIEMISHQLILIINTCRLTLLVKQKDDEFLKSKMDEYRFISICLIKKRSLYISVKRTNKWMDK